ncbi:hypothetical protein Pan241w_28520 [Gimesia alba]|uniref:DUF1559 domain-containing protein n=1 Tax=Gimesia alba TaxID=2527973 RepID=A0A517RFW0_9PLAN|nr:DUF1559 domain-containing protein [Gimesia alba]QDT42763.1 hypothetical protein Pan241w_28520 [Gimesia alba]
MNEPAAVKDKVSTKSWILANKVKLLGGIIVATFSIFFITISNRVASKHRAVAHLRPIFLATINYSSGAAANLPLGGTTDLNGNPQHGWMTAILPFTERRELAEQIDYDKPWTAPENKPVFQTSVPPYLNPDIHEPTTNPAGYALAHYTANSRVLGINKSSNIATISAAGLMQSTILLGEINANFPAWGSANNLRDPAQGLDGGPDRFGSPSGEGATVIFVDGSGKFLNKNIDPAILKAISNPTGRGPVSPNAY